MSRTATIKSLPGAFRMMKAMQAQGMEWGEDYRRANEGKSTVGQDIEGVVAKRAFNFDIHRSGSNGCGRCKCDGSVGCSSNGARGGCTCRIEGNGINAG